MRDRGARRLPVDRQVAGLGEQLLQAQRRAGGTVQSIRRVVCRPRPGPVTATAALELDPQVGGERRTETRGDEDERVAVGLTPAAGRARRELRPRRAEHVGDRLGEREADRSDRCEPRAWRRTADHHGRASGREPAHRDRAPSRSQERAAAATSTEPAAARARARARARVARRLAPGAPGGRPSRRRRRSPADRTSPAPPTPTGPSASARLPERQGRAASAARGACSRAPSPASPAGEPRRPPTPARPASAASVASGARRAPPSGIPPSVGPNARTRSSVPPNGCTSTRASAVASAASVTPDHASTAATNPRSATATTVPRPHSARRRARRGEGRSRERMRGEGGDPIATRRAYAREHAAPARASGNDDRQPGPCRSGPEASGRLRVRRPRRQSSCR